MGLRQDSGCPLCQEAEDTTLHFIAHCSALMLLWKNILGDYTLSLDSLGNIHWFLLLKFAKATVGVAHWAHALASVLDVCLSVGIHPAGKVTMACCCTVHCENESEREFGAQCVFTYRMEWNNLTWCCCGGRRCRNKQKLWLGLERYWHWVIGYWAIFADIG